MAFALRTEAPFDVVGFGLNTVDHVCVVGRPPGADEKQRLRDYRILPGGQVPTALAALQRWGWRTAYVGPLGDDEGGRAQRRDLAAAGIDLRGCRLQPCASQTSVILVDAVSGARTVLWQRPAALPLAAAQLDRAVLAAGRALLLDADDVDTALLAAESARAAGSLVMLDVDEPGPRTDALLALTDAAVVSERFALRHTGAADLRTALRRLTARGPALAAATLGAGGALAFADGAFVYTPAFRVPVIDTTSAGDLFHAGCLHALLHGWPTAAALRFASAAAALSCSALGGRSSIPELAAVKALAARA